MIVENICCQGSVLGYEFYFRSKVLNETNNTYRTIIAMLVVVMGAKLYDWLLYDLIDDLGVAGSNSVFLIACLLITMLFIHSYKKQTDYIRGRVEKYVKSKQIGK